MAVQTTLTSLSTTAASNGPDGTSDAPSTLDDQLRYHGKHIAELRDADHVYVDSISGTNTVTGTIATSPTSYTTGQIYQWIVGTTNTGAVTVNWNSIGAKDLTKRGTSALVGGELQAGACVQAMYDGTRFQLLSVSHLVSGTTVATTSGTEKDWTGIPSWVKRITLMFAGVSTSGTSAPLVQIGDSGGVEATGYLGAASSTANGSSPNVSNYTSGFGLVGAVSGVTVWHGTMVLTLLDASTNTWTASFSGGLSNSATAIHGGGSKALSATLDRIRLTTAGGSDTFDAGSASIMYE